MRDRLIGSSSNGRYGALEMAYRIVVILLALALGACSSGGHQASPPGSSTSATSSTSSASPSESPVSAENNPPGDIPDSQAYVLYHAGRFELKVPEGWARTSTASSVSFADKLNSVAVSWYATSTPPSENRARSSDVPRLQRTVRAFQLRGIGTVTLPAGRTTLITYRANSEPNAVTGRQYRLDVLLYEFFRSGTEADLVLSSPVGADNVDPWRIVSQSFRWP